MSRGIMIFGPSGAGKTALGEMVARQLKFLFVDIDNYIWRKDTAIPFSAMYPRAEKINAIMRAISQADHFVMAGSMDSFHEYFDPLFDLAVHLTAPTQLRVSRVHRREHKLFADRILEGGDMYQAHQRFLADVASYDRGGGSTSFMIHEKWAQSLRCKVLRLDGSDELSLNSQIIADAYNSLGLG